MDPDLLVVIVASAAVVAVIFGFVAYLRHTSRRRLEQLSPAFELGTARLAGPIGNMVEGLYRGYTCHYSVQHPSQYDRGGANLRIFITSPHTWAAETDSAGSKFLVKVGVLKDLEIGDHELDQRLRFSASDDGAVRSTFGVGGVRAAMRALVGSENFEHVRTKENRIDVKFSPRAPALDDHPESLRARLELVTALAEACGYSPALHPPTQ